MDAAGLGVAGIVGARVAVVAGAFIRDAIAVVIDAVAHFRHNLAGLAIGGANLAAAAGRIGANTGGAVREHVARAAQAAAATRVRRSVSGVGRIVGVGVSRVRGRIIRAGVVDVRDVGDVNRVDRVDCVGRVRRIHAVGELEVEIDAVLPDVRR